VEVVLTIARFEENMAIVHGALNQRPADWYTFSVLADYFADKN
jgi:hypothetical protein